MIPATRIVTYQNQAENVVINFFDNTTQDDFPEIGTITFYARLPSGVSNAFSVECTVDDGNQNQLIIPFGATDLATAGNYDYEIWENDGTNPPALKLKGIISQGQGLEIVPTIASTP